MSKYYKKLMLLPPCNRFYSDCILQYNSQAEVLSHIYTLLLQKQLPCSISTILPTYSWMQLISANHITFNVMPLLHFTTPNLTHVHIIVVFGNVCCFNINLSQLFLMYLLPVFLQIV